MRRFWHMLAEGGLIVISGGEIAGPRVPAEAETTATS
jgi:hypothetical protein